MNNTLSEGDNIIYKLVSRDKKEVGNKDIVLFKHNGKTLIKRCQGKAKDTISIINNILFVNGKNKTNEGNIVIKDNNRRLEDKQEKKYIEPVVHLEKRLFI